MDRRDLLKLLTLGPFSHRATDGLPKAIADLEGAARKVYGNVQFEVFVDESERVPLLITVRRV